MKQVTADNYKDTPGDILAELIHNNEAVIIEQSIEGLISIINHISDAIGQRKQLRKRVEVLEAFMKAQGVLNAKKILT